VMLLRSVTARAPLARPTVLCPTERLVQKEHVRTDNAVVLTAEKRQVVPDPSTQRWEGATGAVRAAHHRHQAHGRASFFLRCWPTAAVGYLLAQRE
jgi:hypothetical protein